MSDSENNISNNNKKIFVLDTNVLIHKPDAILSFKESHVVIPLWVLEELDHLKTEHSDRGRSARHAIRFLNDANKNCNGNLRDGLKLSDNITLQVMLTHHDFKDLDLSLTKADNKIILCAFDLQQEGNKVFFVSKDINARIKALSLGVHAVDYEKHKVSIQTLYAGYRQEKVGEDFVKELIEKGEAECTNNDVIANQFTEFSTEESGKTVYLSRFDKTANKYFHVPSSIEPVLGVSPLNVKQRMAFELLLNPDIQCVTLVGKAGTGKTLLALASGLKLVLDDKEYTRVLVSRPIIPMGKDLGYLPGAKKDKMSHWMQPLYDNLEYIIGSSRSQNLKSIDHLLSNKLIEVEALTYIRGRTLPKQFIIIDEAQNLSPHEVKTIVSRAGSDTKVVLTGDPYQIDNPYLDEESNGLTYLVEAFKGQELAGHITLGKSERSKLAELATELL
ncbi:PhoH family protein [Spirochaeta isovalerica]|uniref:PhoH-like ATPase n=1 Tax=Spirochaeta isovalerica TaxID=150 RepID=A0A841R8H4_9SPIO|nr:PhoH family protein [Spirochaeta isovalerica]MBB6481584.1 PhoH-like ATPase [Spirochaeta isovalerica]